MSITYKCYECDVSITGVRHWRSRILDGINCLVCLCDECLSSGRKTNV